MSFLLWHSVDARPMQATLGVASTRKVFRAAEVPVLQDGLQLLEAVGEQARAHAANVTACADAARRDGFEAGRTEGLQQAREASNARWLALARELAGERDALRAQVAELALAATRKIIGELDPGERLAAAAARCAREVLPDEPFDVHVHPSRVADVARALARGAPGSGWPAKAKVVGDDSLDLDGCRVQTAHGSTAVGIEVQLERLAVAWGLEDVHP